MTIVTLLFALYVAVTAVFIVTENCRPQTTFAWMLLFVSFPGVGLVIYFLFGRNRRPFSRQQKLARSPRANRSWTAFRMPSWRR